MTLLGGWEVAHCWPRGERKKKKPKHIIKRSGINMNSRQAQQFSKQFFPTPLAIPYPLAWEIASVPHLISAISFVRHHYFPLALAGNHPCQQQCTSVGGRSVCSCFPGFSLLADGHSCKGMEPQNSLLPHLWHCAGSARQPHNPCVRVPMRCLQLI